MKPKPAALARPARARFIKLNDAGKRMPRAAKTWSQTYDTLTGLAWANVSLQGDAHQSCMDKAAAHRAGSFKFRAPTRAELVSLIDDTRRDPAVDVEFFGNMPPKWHWSSSPVVGWPGLAWYVTFNYGYVDSYDRSCSGFVRPVRVARARQSLALGKATRPRRSA